MHIFASFLIKICANKKRPISIPTDERWRVCYLSSRLINFLTCLLGTMMIRRNQCPIGVTS
nr:MAG TPA: hypothetical protein [Caudoviricetes sp.]